MLVWLLTFCSRFSRWDLCGHSSFSLCDLLSLSRSLWLVSKPSVTSPPLCAPDQLNLCLITKSTDSSRRSCHKSSPSVRSSLTRFRGTFPAWWNHVWVKWRNVSACVTYCRKYGQQAGSWCLCFEILTVCLLLSRVWLHALENVAMTLRQHVVQVLPYMLSDMRPPLIFVSSLDWEQNH